jgi:hypothetical protein
MRRRPPDKPNPTTGQDGRADGLKSSGGLSSKQNKNYAPRIVFASVVRNAGTILAVTPNSLVLGTFKSRFEAAQANGRRA